MKLLFSESRPDCGNYIFPYAIWAIPEIGETPADFFERGFLPSSRNLDRYYLCRNVRVNLRKYQASSENRRIQRKGEGLVATLVPRAEYDYHASRRESFKAYADIKFGPNVMSYERLDSLFSGRIISHLLIFTDRQTSAEVGTVTLYLEPNRLAYYYYAFYDLSYFSKNLGMFMMTHAVEFFREQQFGFLHLGTCYSQNSLYKTQFAGVEFFNGVRWSDRLEELKYLISRQSGDPREHLLEAEEYRRLFYGGDLNEATAASSFQVKINR